MKKAILILVGLLLISAATCFVVLTVRVHRIRAHNAAILASIQVDIEKAQDEDVACAHRAAVYDKAADLKSYKWKLDHLPSRPICGDSASSFRTLRDGAKELDAKGIELQ